jgi:TPR repeat protein
MLAAGIGTATDEKAATRWLQSAAQAGFSRASEKLEETGLTTDIPLPAADPPSPSLSSISGLTGASAEVRDIIEWNLRLPNDWRLNEIDRQDDDRIIDHLPQMAHRNYRIQLGIFDSRPRAVAFWQRLVGEYPSLLMNLQPFIESSQYAAQRIAAQQPATTHRIQAGTFRSFNAAKAMCSALLAARVESGCLPVTAAAEG